MVGSQSGDFVSEIAKKLIEFVPNNRTRILLYSEVEDMALSLAIFLDEGNRLFYFQGDDQNRESALNSALFDLWYETPPEKRWAEIEMFVHDGKFEASFNYKDDIDLSEDEFLRRDRIVAKYFGEKPIFYPPLKRYDGLSFDL